MPIYCDEAGYTGRKLLHDIQPYFVYASINIEEEEAEEFCRHLKKQHRLQGELKGANLVGSAKGQRALKEIYESYASVVKLSYHHKKYALACKFYEYIFEPIVASKSSFFYQQGFHIFIANLLYHYFEETTDPAENIFHRFQQLMLGENRESLFSITPEKKGKHAYLDMIYRFAVNNRTEITDEISTDGEFDPWILDLSHTALYHLLCAWGLEIKELIVICDVSKPLEDAVERYSDLYATGKETIMHDFLGNGDIPITFNLKEAVHFTTSKLPGIQMADLFASSTYWALKNPNEEFASYIHKHLQTITTQGGSNNIVPENTEMFTPSNPFFKNNIEMLKRFVKYSEDRKGNLADRIIQSTRKDIEKKMKKNLSLFKW